MEGLLKHGKALVISTTGGPEQHYKSTGLFDAYVKTTNGFFKPFGIQDVEYTCFFAVPSIGDERRNTFLESAYLLGKEFFT